MSHRILKAADHRRMPWKNGRGETVEIAVHPQGAGLTDFGWRVSMAGVSEDGDFSIFPQIDRTLAVLTGEGIELDVQGQARRRLTPESGPLAFPADVPTSARLLGGPITDLNVMTRRGAFTHRLSRLTEAAVGAPGWRLVLATAPVVLDLAGATVALDQLDALFCEGPDAALPVGPAADAWLIEIDRA
ncbi:MULTISPECIES: HutD family protein [Paracoccus]|uniref:HutD/Ves family protein n=1 Tax=Paracoccus TaxID=265 RepID=UPI001E2C5623|nr:MULTISPECIES: HutD family protein [Paracoccus]MDK8874308.1 HutD family protein [Paracoccus sp. SSJ]UFS63912.1 HutD family protein [Paracoccus denitrificans]